MSWISSDRWNVRKSFTDKSSHSQFRMMTRWWGSIVTTLQPMSRRQPSNPTIFIRLILLLWMERQNGRFTNSRRTPMKSSCYATINYSARLMMTYHPIWILGLPQWRQAFLSQDTIPPKRRRLPWVAQREMEQEIEAGEWPAEVAIRPDYERERGKDRKGKEIETGKERGRFSRCLEVASLFMVRNW